jgi:hypothetical protein
MPQLHETMYGKAFFDSQLPRLIEAVKIVGMGLQDHLYLQKNADTLRPCTVREEGVDIGPFRFHRWANIKPETHNPLTVTAAIVEDEDGQIILVYPEHVRFTDRDEEASP